MKRGRQSAADAAVVAFSASTPDPPAPDTLAPEALALWRDIVRSRPPGYFGSGDLPLLAEYCRTTATFLPGLNRVLDNAFDLEALAARDRLIRQAATLAGKLRLCVSARTRPDSASTRDAALTGPRPWESPTAD